MTQPVRLAIAGVGNNISALFQGAEFYRTLLRDGVAEANLPGISHPRIGGIGVADLAFVAAFDTSPTKVGQQFHDAILAPPNNYPRLDVALPRCAVVVEPGLGTASADHDHPTFRAVVERIRASGAEVLLYSLPTGLQWAADAYATAALEAGVAFVNCTPEIVARDPGMMARYEAAGLPLVGDDLASQLGSSVVHRALLALLRDRGITLASSYQLNLGGNEDFRNLRENGGSKRQSKLNALAQEGVDAAKVVVIPSAGYVSHLADRKVGMLNIEGLGWGGTPVTVELTLKVQDSSNAAGVIIDLIRIAAASRRAGIAGFPTPAAVTLKSPPAFVDRSDSHAMLAALRRLDARPADADADTSAPVVHAGASVPVVHADASASVVHADASAPVAEANDETLPLSGMLQARA